MGRKFTPHSRERSMRLGNPNLHTEVSYLNGQVVPRGTTRMIRCDVVEGR